MTCSEENPTSNTEINVTYKSPSFSTCSHDWDSGISSAYPDPIRDGTLILVKKGDTVGAFILSEQTLEPEKTKYHWWYRDDGSGELDIGLEEVTSGTDILNVSPTSSNSISFGPFRIAWSGNAVGKGYIYYKYSPGWRVSPSELRICVTDKSSINGINALDDKWKYKGTPAE